MRYIRSFFRTCSEKNLSLFGKDSATDRKDEHTSFT